MSVTYDLACHDCSQQLWVGQRDYIYTTPEHLANLKEFFFAHQGHQLQFDREGVLDYPDKTLPDDD